MQSLTWKSYPARERPLATVFVVIFIAVIMSMVYYVMDKSIFMMALAGLIFTVSLSTFFFPTTYTVDDEKVSIKYTFSAKERNMSAFRKAFPESRGILLSPYSSPTRLENFRGFYLRYGKDNKAEVDAFVAKLLDKQRERSELESSPERVRPDEVSPDAV
jgi:hypothetical protein